MTTEPLLPSNATPLQRALSVAMARGFALRSDVDAVTDPQRAPAGALPFTAYEHSVDIWDRDWDEQKKRNVVARSFELHRQKGTLAGIKLAVDMAGGEVIRAVVPPGKTHLAPNRSEAEMQAFYARHPQLRIYRFRDRGSRVGAIMGHAYVGTPSSCPRRSDAEIRYGARAFLWDQGTETPLTTIDRREDIRSTDAVEFVEVRRKGSAKGGTYVRRFARFGLPSTAADRLYTIRTSTTYQVSEQVLARRDVIPSLQPIDVRVEKVAEQGTRRGVMQGVGFFGDRKCFLNPSTAATRLYSRTYLHDPERRPEARGRTTHLGVMRLNMPAYTAELLVQVRGRTSRRRFGRYVGGHLMKPDPSRVDRVVEAVRLAKAARDRVLLNFAVTKPVTAGYGIKAGDLVAGAWRRSV